MGPFLSIIAGLLISTQNVFNSRLSEKGGSWAATTIVLGGGFLCSLPVFYFTDNVGLFQVGGVNPVYLFSGVFGVGIVYCFMRGISLMGPAYAVSIVMVSQLTIAFVINSFGLFGFEEQPVTLNKMIGIIMLIIGVLVFKLGDRLPFMKKSTQKANGWKALKEN
ncbi:DMT family transporter [Thalassobacillus hwangdonensis]|uniref:DMT family transporter n=1 Tax=Thalassobacillus hwangdonensis TaxID=546108 RepID=A0ABW3KY58_9BACI